ncbi:hypothetical protein K7X08_031627 [Anisodus acutangulus]|uniref:beta-aspartyl-peptidase n=1 Tax=Anisodus acutangulus TaxID=402998 RepID=A0A9Q1MLF7_9SOLA|nr:hypothetical protein K7X08_031627 [Anisodus acutangulus]
MFHLLQIPTQVRELENDPHFNAGECSVMTNNGTIEMEACIMDGSTKKCGAVSGLTTVVNAVSLARLVMEKTPHIYLAFDGAEAFVSLVDYTQPMSVVDEPPVPNGDSQIGTVGCVAVDSSENLAAATSTGGLVNKMVARDVAALMEYKGLTLKKATDYVIKESTPKGTTGLIAVSAKGEVVTPFNTTGMFRACATQDSKTEIGIW